REPSFESAKGVRAGPDRGRRKHSGGRVLNMARVETTIEYNGRSFRVRCEPEKVLEALRLYESGKTAKEAGGVSGIAEWTVARLARKVGIARSPRQALLKRYNDPNSPEGRKRRVLARRVWELRGKGLTQH